MAKQYRRAWIAFFVIAVSVIIGTGEGLGLAADTNLKTYETPYSVQVSSEGLGADQQEPVIKAVELIKQGEIGKANSILDGVLSRFAKLMEDNTRTYVCFRQTSDYNQFLDDIQSRQGLEARSRVTRIHDSFVQALQMKAYIASAMKQWDQAIDYLNKKISYAPYDAQPYIEMGYVLNQQGKTQMAFDTYKKAYALAVEHSTAKMEQAMALRGMGTSLIDLGKLDDAVASFNKSLELDPGNKIALSELQYIEQIRNKSR